MAGDIAGDPIKLIWYFDTKEIRIYVNLQNILTFFKLSINQSKENGRKCVSGDPFMLSLHLSLIHY